MSADKDKIHRFLFDQANIRGEVVHLQDVWQLMQTNHQYPEVIRQYLGEVLAAAVLLSATLKFEGSLTIQASGDGALTLMVVECRHDFGVRAVAKYQSSLLNSDFPKNNSTTIKTLLGQGNLVITIEQARNKERYQGIVALEGESVADFLEGYLLRSEQLSTRIFLASDEYTVAGLLLQQLPASNHQQDEDDDCWDRVTHLANTIKSQELLGLDTKELLYRLYHEEKVRLFESDNVYFKCSCSREKVTNMLHSISQQEASQIIKEQGNISVDCEFCGTSYQFDEIDIGSIYSQQNPISSSSIKH
jgi:molecular chaperone Hsp33